MIYPGAKEPDDLFGALEVGGRRFFFRMELAFAMLDFLCENEDYLMEFRPHWKSTGRAYVMEAAMESTKFGWRRVAQRIREQRRRRAA